MEGQKHVYSPSIPVRIALGILIILGYIILCLLLYPIHGASASVIVILPVAVWSWYFGLLGGLLAGLMFFVVNVLILSLITYRPLEEIILYGAPSYLAMILVGITVSRLHDLSVRLKQELNRRKQMEKALQESETRYRSLIEQSPFSVQIFRPDGSVIAVNQAFCTLWNASPIEAQYIVDHYNILKDEQLEASGLMPFIKQGFTERFAQIPAIRYDPQKTDMVKDTHLAPKWVLGFIWPIKDEQDRVQQVVLMHQDITERKQVEIQELELALTHERADLLKELLNTLSHDLKTPLSIINTSLYLVEKTSDPIYQKNKLDTVKDQAQRLNKMIQNIITASYLEGVSDIVSQSLNLNIIAEQVREEFMTIAEGRSITFELILESTLPPARISEIEFRRVLVNLVENALSYTPPQGQVSLLTFKKVDHIVIEVRDTGIGIEEADLPHVFDHFYRADKARATHNGGTGLGLAIAKKIIERYEGRIEVESTPGQGTSFRVWLPIFQESTTQ